MKYLLILLSLSLGAWNVRDSWRSVTPQVLKLSSRCGVTELPMDVHKSLDIYMIQAQMEVESHGDWGAVSREGCRGSMQVHPETAKAYSIPTWTLDHPVLSLDAGITIMSKLWTRFNNVSMPERWELCLASYNAGYSRTIKSYLTLGKRWQRGIPGETRSYIHKVMRRYYGK